MLALSITQPWGWAILNAGKDIENRDWSTDYRGVIAIHAPKKISNGDEYSFDISFIKAMWGLSHKGTLKMPNRKDHITSAIIGIATIIDCVRYHQSPWFQGEYGFVLKDVIALSEPISCAGALKLWRVSDEIEAQIHDQLSRIK